MEKEIPSFGNQHVHFQPLVFQVFLNTPTSWYMFMFLIIFHADWEGSIRIGETEKPPAFIAKLVTQHHLICVSQEHLDQLVKI